MANSSDIRAGRAFVEIGTEDAPLDAGLDSAKAKLEVWGSMISRIGAGLAAAGAAITAPLLAAANSAARSGAALYDMSRRTGVGVEELSRLGFAADMAGSNLGEVEISIRRMQKAITGAKDEVDGTTGSVAALGLSLDALKGKSTAEQFNMIAERIAQIPNATERSAAAMSVFGRSATSMLPMIERLAKLREMSDRLGFTEQDNSVTIRQQKEMADLFTLSSKAGARLWEVVGTAIMPTLKRYTETMIRVTLAVGDWVDRNRGLVTTLFRVGTVLGVVGTAVFGLGKAMQVAIPAMQGFSVALKGVLGTFGFLLSPIGLVGAALVAAAGYFLFFTDTGGKALAWLGEKFSILKTDALTAFGGIADAISAGNIQLAAKIVWAYLKLEWARGVSALGSYWTTLQKWGLETFYDLSAGIQNAFTYLKQYLSSWDGVKTAMQKVMTWMVNAWQNAVNVVADLIQDTIGTNAKGALKQGLARIDALEKSGDLSKPQADAQREAEYRTFGDYDQKARDQRDSQLASDYAAKQAALDAEFARKQPGDAAAGERSRAAIEAARAAAIAAVRAMGFDEAEAEASIRRLENEMLNLRNQAANEKGDSDLGLGLLPDGVSLDGLAGAVGAVKSMTLGTFNAREAQGFGSDTYAMQTAKNTKEIADWARRNRDPHLSFGRR